MVPSERIPITERALVQRINRKLMHVGRHGRTLRKSRGLGALQNLGEYYVLDFDTNFVIDKDVDLEYFGRELGCLAEWEYLEVKED
jgi:hypothetical protein